MRGSAVSISGAGIGAEASPVAWAGWKVPRGERLAAGEGHEQEAGPGRPRVEHRLEHDRPRVDRADALRDQRRRVAGDREERIAAGAVAAVLRAILEVQAEQVLQVGE